MTRPAGKTGGTAAVAAILFAVLLAGCGGGGGAGASASPEGPAPDGTPAVSRILSWSPPTSYLDNTPLDPSQDIAGYNIYVKPSSSEFGGSDEEIAFTSAADTSIDLVPVCHLNGLPPGSYHVSVRAVAKNGLMSDFSPAAPFTL